MAGALRFSSMLVIAALLAGCGDKKADKDGANGGSDAAANGAAKSPDSATADGATADGDLADGPAGDDTPQSGGTKKPANDAGQAAADTSQQTAPIAGGFDVSAVTDAFIGAIVLHPQRLIGSKLIQGLPAEDREEFLGDFEKNSGMPVDNVVRAVVLVGMNPDADNANLDGPPFSRTESPVENNIAEKDTAESAPTEDPAEDQFEQGDLPIEEFNPPPSQQLMGGLVWFEKPLTAGQQEKIVAGMMFEPQKAVHEGIEYYSAGFGPRVSFVSPTQMVMSDNQKVFEQMLTGQGGSGPLAKQLAALELEADIIAVGVLSPVRDLINAGLQDNPLPGPLAGFASVVNLIDVGSIRLDITNDPLLQLALEGPDEKKAQQLKNMAGGMLMLGSGVIAQSARDPNLSPDQRKMIEEAAATLQQTQVEQRGKLVTLTIPRPANFDQQIGSALTQAIVEARKAARRLDVDMEAGRVGLQAIVEARKAARRAQQMSNLHQVAIAMLNYETTHGHFPPAVITDDAGKPLYSWRVALLPYLEAGNVADAFKQDEPWDSEHNKQFLSQMPAAFGHPASRGPGEGQAQVLVFVGEGTPFSQQGKVNFSSIKDGTTNTVMCILVGADKAVSWTKPEDLKFDPENFAASLGEIGDSATVVCMDGHVETIPRADFESRLKLMVTHDGGEAVPGGARHGFDDDVDEASEDLGAAPLIRGGFEEQQPIEIPEEAETAETP